jgi:hypothetical protein
MVTSIEKSESVLQPRHCSMFSLYLEFYMSKCVDSCFVGKLRQFSRTFITTICSNSDVSNDIVFRQEDKDCHISKLSSTPFLLLSISLVVVCIVKLPMV